MSTNRPRLQTAGDPAQPSGGWLARWGVFLGAVVIVLAVWLVYANSLATPFVFDDLKSITQNPTIRHLWPLSDVLSPPNEVTGAAGRPMVNLSLAINYAISGLDVKSYHVVNTLIHALAALTLFGVVRRTLRLTRLRDRFGTAALPLAWAVALLWAVHPLQTESVTCVVQRTESLMGLFYLLTFYAFIRSVEGAASRGWQVVTVIVCLLGMATKEVMVSAPVLLLLYDRTFVAGSFAAAWRARGWLYIALAATWLMLAWLTLHSGQRGGAAGFGLGVSAWDYALTQCRAIILYLQLAIWPHPLVVDYGTHVVQGVGEVWPQAMVLLALVTGTFVALRRWPMVGFLAFSFFAILAPSSSVVPLVSQTIAEHRMYLSLAALIILAVLGGYCWLGVRSVAVWLALSVVSGVVTARRNEDYRDPLTLWGVTAAEQPDNGRAQMNFATALANVGRLDEARGHFAASARLTPAFAEAHYSLAGVLLQLRRPAEAEAAAAEAVRLRPDYAEAHYVLATAMLQQGRMEEALAEYGTALRLKPDFADAEHTLAGALVMAGRTPEAFQHYEAALRLQPTNALLHAEMGSILARQGRLPEALDHFQTAERLDPGAVGVRYNMGNVLFALHRYGESAEQYAAVVRLRPDFAEAHNNLGNALTQLGRLDEAQKQYEETLRLKPEFAPARNNLRLLQAERAEGVGR
ncbi:MAG: tetratricopeptide repeat protein [Opitutaceae bacterium]